VVVVGGGIAGLAAAHALLTRAGDGPAVRVTLLEAGERVGGKLQTSPFAGVAAIDEGPDAFLARLPWATKLARDVGLGDELTPPASGSASVWWHGLQPIPEGLLLGMPTDVLKLARTKLLSWPAKARAALEPLLARTDISDDSIGSYVRRRFGNQVHERLVDPLVGSIYASDTDRFSLAAVPQIAALATEHRSVLIAGRKRPPAPGADGPVFIAPRGGLGRLVDATRAAVEQLGGAVSSGEPVASLMRDGSTWRVNGRAADGVILACPAWAAAPLLDDERLASIEYADVAMVTVAIPAATWPERLTGQSGYLVPKEVQRFVTAASFGSQKWPHWGAGGSVVLRISLGRDGLPVLQLGDDELIAAAISETGRHIGVDLQPTATRVSRWLRAFPQYRPHHHDLVRTIEADLPPTLALAGASYHGIGIPACVRSAQAAADRVLAATSTG
jgi:protoporphyrinogen/coproporphyrinogen III oxidase